MITFEQWSTSWNIYIQSFSYSTAVFYNTFLSQCHLVKNKMLIWNAEIALVLWCGLNTYTDHFNYIPVRYTALPCLSCGWYIHLLWITCFSEVYNQNNLISFSTPIQKPAACGLWKLCACGVSSLSSWECAHPGNPISLPLILHQFPSYSTSFQDWPSPEGRWRFQLYALTNSILSVTGMHQGIHFSIQGFQFMERKTIKVLILLERREGPAVTLQLWQIRFYITKKRTILYVGLQWFSIFHLLASYYSTGLHSLFQHKHCLKFLSFSLFACPSLRVTQNLLSILPIPSAHLFTKCSHCNSWISEIWRWCICGLQLCWWNSHGSMHAFPANNQTIFLLLQVVSPKQQEAAVC